MGPEVSAPAVRKTSMRDGWCKVARPVAGVSPSKVSKPSKVSQRNHAKVSQAPKETITETIPKTIKGRASPAVLPDDGEDSLSNSELSALAPLEPKEQRFVDEYLIDLNATQATIRAGYSSKAARQLSAKLMAKASIRTAIAIAQDARAKRTEIDADRALTEAWAIMTAADRVDLWQADDRENLFAGIRRRWCRTVQLVKTGQKRG